MARGRPRRPPPPDHTDDPISVDNTEHFSPLLWIPHSEHRVSLASRESQDLLECKNRAYGMQYYSLMDTESKATNASLIQALVERWRPETHTFHFQFGEMTVTLQDVSVLWGLPIQGVPVGGISYSTDDNTINATLAELLGAEPAIRDNGGKSRFHVKKTALRALFANRGLHWGSTEQDIERYTRAFVMDLFGSVMFADSSGDSIPIMYLELLRDLGTSRRYNWGGAVLAHLYSNLCRACKPKSKQIYGPTLLLQHWSWSRIPVVVPVPNEPDDAYRPALGKKWYGDHRYVNQLHGKTVGIRLVRGQLQSLGDTQVSWTLYSELYDEGRLPQIVSDDEEMWLYRGPLVCFWIVEHHYPDRVLRQFGLPPLIPADPDIPRSIIMGLHGCCL
ncbi:serine/threonine-protein phosphatase 7 long form homolog [Carex rostrata]